LIQANPNAAPAARPNAVIATPGKPTATAVYEGLRAQRRELTNQLDELESTRRSIISQLEDIPAGDPARKPLETRMTEVDSRIASVDGMLAGNSGQLAQAAAVPGAVIEPVKIIQDNGPPEEAYILGGLFLLVALLPISIAYARRIWRRSSTAVAAFPRDLADRLSRIEQGMDATSVEVERIGEGQRFITRLFTEGEGARAISAADSQKGTRLPERLP
jgi:hypothetical protein